MKHKFSFTLSKLDSTKRDMVTRAADDLTKLLEAAQTLQPLYHSKWLGSAISAEDVRTYTGRMAQFVSDVLTTLGTASAEGVGGGSFAYCNAEKYRGVQSFGAAYAYGPQCTMLLGPNFFHDKVSRGERAQTLLHELTHLALATTDEKVTVSGKDEDAYGDYCLELLRLAPDRAKRNADNWGFYFTAYRGGLGWSEQEAMYLEADEISAVRGKRFK